MLGAPAVGERLRAPLGATARWLAAAVGLSLLALAAPWMVDPPTLVPSIDGAWMMSLTEAAVHGEISGRDIYATHGWAFQRIGLWARSLHANRSSYDSTPLFAVLLSVLGAAVLVAALLLVRSIDAAGLLLSCGAIALLNVGHPAWLRAACLLLIAAATARWLQAPSGRWFFWRLGGLTILAASLQSLSFDLGAYAVLTVAGGTVLDALCGSALPQTTAWRQRAAAAARRAGVVLAAAALTYIAFSLTLSGGAPAPFDYLSVLSRISSGYTATMGSAWQGVPEWTFVLALLVLFVVCTAGADLRSEDRSVRTEAAPFLCAALLHVRGGMVRSDVYHIALAAVPLVVFFLILALRTGQTLRRRLAAAAVFIALCCTWPGAQFGALKAVAQVAASPDSLRQRLAELCSFDAARNVYVPVPLRAGGASGLVVFPYLNQFALITGRRLIAPFVQTYQATTAGLDRMYADRIGADPNVDEALYALDDLAVGRIDGVAAITRNPAIFTELYRRFRPVGPAADAYLLLRRTTAVREFPATALPFLPATGSPLGGVVLAAPAECALLRVRFQVDYPWTRSLGRISKWRATRHLGGQATAMSHVVALDRDEFTTILGLGPSAEIAAVFAGGAPRHAFDRLTFEIADRSLFAVAPRSVGVAALDCLNP